MTADVNFSWNYEKVFTATHRPWCAVTLPDNAMSDVQTAGEYVVYTLRTMYAAAHRKGTLDAEAVCLLGCAASLWQQRTGSAFLHALNAGQETYAGISYTQIYTTTLDEVVVPNVGPAASSALHTGPGRISSSVCTQLTMPGVTLQSAVVNLLRVGVVAGTEVALYPRVPEEPARAAYAG